MHILVTSFTGVIEEHHFGEAFTESLPFTALLVVATNTLSLIAESTPFAIKNANIWCLPSIPKTTLMIVGTNIPSVATPNGQAAFLFLLTSTLAPLIRLSYLQMMKLALPTPFAIKNANIWCLPSIPKTTLMIGLNNPWSAITATS